MTDHHRSDGFQTEDAEPASLGHPAPAQPAVVIRLLDALAGEHRLPAGAADLMAVDPALSLWALSAASSLLPARQLPSVAEALGSLDLACLKARVVQEALAQLGKRQHPSERMQTWRQALHAAYLGDALARELSYPQPHEARLAGLLHNLYALPAVVWDVESLFRESDAALAARVEAWRYATLLPDALRYQHWPLDALRDASTLVQILWAARHLADADGQASEQNAADLLGLPPDTVANLRNLAGVQADATLAEHTGGAKAIYVMQEQPVQLRLSLIRFASLEQLMVGMLGCPEEDAGLVVVSRHLREAHGLEHPLYFHHEPTLGRLVSRHILPGEPPPALSVRVEGSEAAAALSYQWRRPVMVTVGNGGDSVSLLDAQIARLAGREGVLAIPVGDPAPRGVLVVCGYRAQIAALGEDMTYLAKLGVLAGRARPQGAAAERETRSEWQAWWQTRARQLAHEINNPLGIIKNYLALLRVKLGGEGAISDELRIIHEELDRIARIVQSLTLEAVEPARAVAEVDVNALLADLVTVAAAGVMLQKRVQVDQRLEEGLPRLRSDRDKLKQLLLNLLLNAIEASAEGGRVGLETHRLINHKLERQLEILVSNSGADIAPEVLARLFEPVESAKGEGHIGIGLSIVRALAAELGATVACRSHHGQTTFQVLLPME